MPRDIGHQSPQNMRFTDALAPQADPAEGFDEDCLVLNVWTPGVNDGHKRPVMFWIHGGGFAQESGSWPWIDGAALARRGDVVVITINHRLNIFGYLHLADIGGEKYAASGNAGMLDLVAGSAMGSRQHRPVRRRSEQCDDLRRVRRRRKGLHAPGDAGRERLVSSRGNSERLMAARCAARGCSGHRESGARKSSAFPLRISTRFRACP